MRRYRICWKAFQQYEHLEGVITHSDQGWQYQMKTYHQALEERGTIQSMSRKDNYLDNAPMENFFGIMKNEMFYGHEAEFETLDEVREAMEEYNLLQCKTYRGKTKRTDACSIQTPILGKSSYLIFIVSNFLGTVQRGR